jgi:hypothetical protein
MVHDIGYDGSSIARRTTTRVLNMTIRWMQTARSEESYLVHVLWELVDLFACYATTSKLDHAYNYAYLPLTETWSNRSGLLWYLDHL